MTGDIAVSLANVTKKYRLFTSPAERLKESLHPFRKRYHKEFCALEGVSFDIAKGQVVGILGRNGSGKSTLLQIIASVLQATSGDITVNGRVSALLELGAGFNPEFTGRQNVLINGAIMGMSREEMLKRMPDIMAFADVGEFFDQPMKTYSSGMFMRVAFAAATNVDPDILIVDEALAVGDAKFQSKCYQKFIDYKKQGKTIVLVTHDANAVVKHCNWAVLLEKGKVVKTGSPKDVVDHYYQLFLTGSIDTPATTPPPSTLNGISGAGDGASPSELKAFLNRAPTGDHCLYRNSYNKNEHRFGDRRAEIVDYLIVAKGHADAVTVHSGDWVDIYLKVIYQQALEFPIYGFSIKTVDGIVVYASNSKLRYTPVRSAKEGDVVVFKFSLKFGLHEGDYFIDLGVAENCLSKDNPIDVRYGVIHLNVRPNRIFDGFTELEGSFEEIPTQERAIA